MRLIPVAGPSDILPVYRATPIGLLLASHNLGMEPEPSDTPRLLVGMCMDHRKRLRIPDNFAYIIRTGGGNLRYSEFNVSYAVAVAGVKAMALIVHNNCGMVGLMAKKEAFVQGLVENGGWKREWAEDHFNQFAPMFEIGNEIDFVLGEAKRLRTRYAKVQVAPLFYKLEDNLLYQVREEEPV